MDVKSYIEILRPEQWYKNLIVFAALFFSFNLFDISKLILTFIGFIIMCLLSSANYIFNDITDKRRDFHNYIKKQRPVASGKVSIKYAIILMSILAIMGLLGAYLLNRQFFVLSVLFIILTSFYSLFFKNIVFIDILLIAINFVIRAVAGAFIINVFISPWLVLTPFFLSLFLSIGKRRAELSSLGKSAVRHRNTLMFYPEDLTNSLLTITTTLVVITYALYTVSVDNKLLLTLPFVMYAIFRYFSLIYSNSAIAIRPELVFKDLKFMIALIMWTATAFIVLY